MTAQIPDKFIYKGQVYELVGIKGDGLVEPQQFCMLPEMIHTACYRGFYATYELTESTLFLHELTLREKNGNYLPIGGVEAEQEEYQATYHNLNVIVPFNGKIRLAKDFIEELYIHMGYQKPTAFRTVLDITLQEGTVVAVNDRSKEMQQKRGAFKRRYEAGEMIEEIEEAFGLDMDLE
jgi:hypothetical protein